MIRREAGRSLESVVARQYFALRQGRNAFYGGVYFSGTRPLIPQEAELTLEVFRLRPRGETQKCQSKKKSF